ncbi:hypothetical protein BASA60_000864 [Batrachochytrium salamandrivorans]|nr:hypothetical protein BASA60_000864 [Batrachochytrium salamandrivorans]
MLLGRLFMDLDELQMDRKRLLEAKTYRGIFNNLLGYVFSVYCIFKTCMAMINIVLNRQGETDPITRTLDVLVHYAGVEIDAKLWAKDISFALLGVLVVVSVRGLLLQFANVVLMLRINLPIQHRANVERVLGNVEFSFYLRWFDVIFVLSAITSSGALYILTK